MAPTLEGTARWSVLILYLCSGVLTEEKCKSSNPCTCTLGNGTIINLEPLSSDTTPRFSEEKFNKSTNVTTIVTYNPCHPFTQETECTNVAGCHNVTENGNSTITSLGIQESAEWSKSNDNWIITYKAADKVLEVTLNCVDNLTMDKSYFNITRDDGKTVTATLTSLAACSKDPNPGDKPKKGISTGTLLIILFLVFLVLYLVGGIIYKKIIYGATGKEFIPNVEFWMAFPGLVLDGVAFTCNCCGKRRSRANYDDV